MLLYKINYTLHYLSGGLYSEDRYKQNYYFKNASFILKYLKISNLEICLYSLFSTDKRMQIISPFLKLRF